MRFCLVHGGWQAGWVWDAVAERLRSQGHTVLAPTLRGSEDGPVDRSRVSLSVMGDALAERLDLSGARDIVLVGHSGGGPVVQYVANRLTDRVGRLVFVDAWVLRDREAINDVLPEPLVAASIAAAEQTPDATVPMDPGLWAQHFMNGAPADLVEQVAARLVPVPFGWLSEPI